VCVAAPAVAVTVIAYVPGGVPLLASGRLFRPPQPAAARAPSTSTPMANFRRGANTAVASSSRSRVPASRNQRFAVGGAAGGCTGTTNACRERVLIVRATPTGAPFAAKVSDCGAKPQEAEAGSPLHDSVTGPEKLPGVKRSWKVADPPASTDWASGLDPE